MNGFNLVPWNKEAAKRGRLAGGDTLAIDDQEWGGVEKELSHIPGGPANKYNEREHENQV
ncbi:hypothetical protein KDA_45820 [Dictyobacter alpinus]|uniref:Uncharacterized protein n=1 Tax=Dictyobacter alpinus TaxID=2014873 RepID=A0A402BCG9_9CHLR|nr:hypothetical protein KDA_45820 [Dictyobacter alpinus]